MQLAHYISLLILLGGPLLLMGQGHSRSLGQKSFEVSNHLGSVIAVTSDRKVAEQGSRPGLVATYESDVVSYNDYYPYGMLIEERNDSKGYRFGFQGQEKDDEVQGKGNLVNYKYRMHNPRLGRFFAVDPLSGSLPYSSSYAFSENNVVIYSEFEGKEKDSGLYGEISFGFYPKRVHNLFSISGKLGNNFSDKLNIGATFSYTINSVGESKGNFAFIIDPKIRATYSFSLKGIKVQVSRNSNNILTTSSSDMAGFGIKMIDNLLNKEGHVDVGLRLIDISNPGGHKLTFSLVSNPMKSNSKDLIAFNLIDEKNMEQVKGKEKQISHKIKGEGALISGSEDMGFFKMSSSLSPSIITTMNLSGESKTKINLNWNNTAKLDWSPKAQKKIEKLHLSAKYNIVGLESYSFSKGKISLFNPVHDLVFKPLKKLSTYTLKTSLFGNITYKLDFGISKVKE